MKKIFVITVFLSFLSLAAANIEPNEPGPPTDVDWGASFSIGQKVNCVSHYIPQNPDVNIPGSLKFARLEDIDFLEDTSSYYGDPDTWSFGKSSDQVYLYGEEITGQQGWAWGYKLWFEWEEGDVIDNPVYFDTAYYNGEQGSEPLDMWGTVGYQQEGEWVWETSEDPYSSQKYIKDNYTNPVPEPASLLLFAGGVWFAARRKRVKS
jgi:hypothetical protein